jgi:hypothetical protein
MKKYKTICFLNGILSIVLGCIPMIYEAVTPISGVARTISKSYDSAVKEMVMAVDKLEVLVAVGSILIIVAILLNFIPHKEDDKIKRVLIIVPLGLTLLWSLINYIPLIDFHITHVLK